MKIIPFPFHLHRREKKEHHNNDHREEGSNGGATFHIKHKNSHGDDDEHCQEDTRKSSTPCSTSHRHGPEVHSGTKMTQCQPRPQSPSSLRTSRRRLRKGFLNTLDEMVDEQLHDDPALLQALSVQNMMEIDQV
mmetsp:Transcript_13801/g.33241  ORF Transcript_13801/g.33241 Transcript_13801/m.33241 type:complete len:134 (-) Transcript_13801:199-600(-)